MRKMISVLLTVFMLFSFAACGDSQESAAQNNQPQQPADDSSKTAEGEIDADDGGSIELNFVQSYADESGGEYINTIIAEFESLNPNVTINLVTVAEDEMLDYLLDESNKADIFTVRSYHTMDLYNANRLASLEGYMAEVEELQYIYEMPTMDSYDGTYYINEFHPQVVTEIDNAVYSVPLFLNSSVLFGNIAELNEFFLANNDFESTLGYARWGTNPELDYYGMALLLTNNEPVQSVTDTILPILYGYNGSLMQGDVFSIDTPEMLQTMQFLATLGENGYVSPDTTQATEEEVVGYFTDAQSVVLLTNLENGYAEEVLNAEYPYPVSLNPNASNMLTDDSTNIAISASCEYVDAAFEFVSYLSHMQPNLARALGKAEASISMYAEERGSNRSQTRYLYTPELQLIGEIKYLPYAEECFAELTMAAVAVLQGDKTPEQAIADCQAAWDGILGQ